MKLLHIKVVLAAIDCDEISLRALKGAGELASASGATLHVVHVTEATGNPDAAKGRARADRAWDVHRMLEDAGVATSEARLHLLSGDRAYVIRSLADSVRADVIVLGRHRDASAHAPLGSTTMRVVTSSWAPCLILSDSMTLPLERVLAPIDLSDASRGTLVVALSWASALRGAARLGASRTDEPVRLTALHVARSLDEGATGQRRTLDEMLDRLRADAGGWAGVTIAGVVAEGRDASSTIADYTREHDVQLLVLGTRGLGTGAVGRLGSVSLGVAQRVTTPVLLVPPALWSADSARP